jgi:hypothetical protein
MDIMNEAATYYNVDRIPSTLGSNWQFKWNAANPRPSWINCAHGYAALQNWIAKTRFYLYGSESVENPVFLSEPVRLRIESNHPGY